MTAPAPAPIPIRTDHMPENHMVLTARLKASHEMPYYDAVLHKMRIVLTEEVPVMGVDKWWRVYINPNPFNASKYSIGETEFIWIHELYHLLNNHAGRREKYRDSNGEAKPARWNIAADIAINQIIAAQATEMLTLCRNDEAKAKCMKLPDGALMPKPKDGKWQYPEWLSVEEYYALVTEEIEQNPNGAMGQLEQQIEGSRMSPQAMGGGSAADGIKRSWEKGGPTEEQKQDGEATGMDEADGNLYRKMTAESVKAYDEGTNRETDNERKKRRGTIPLGLKRWADAVMAPPQVPWQQKLKGNVRRIVTIVKGEKVDYSRRYINRRQAAYGNVLMPSMISTRPRVFVGIDTSGSMGAEELTMAVIETGGILKASGCGQIDYCAIDASIHAVKTIVNAKQIELLGGGGTNMNPAMDYAAEKKYDICVIITDGYVGSWGERRNGLKVVACVLNHQAEEPPAWANTIRIEPKAMRKAS